MTPDQKAKLQTVFDALRMFIGCAYPCSEEIDARGYEWDGQTSLDEALRAAKEALAVCDELMQSFEDDGWRTMDSAPKDGKEILVCGNAFNLGPQRFYVVARWTNDAWCAVNTENPIYPPVCWMPLPAPKNRGEGV